MAIYNKNNYLAKNEYTGIDVIKLICSFLILFIHTTPLLDLNSNNYFGIIDFYTNECLFRIAVPFFFTCTGFLLFKNEISNCEKAKNYLFKILRLLGTWYAISYCVGTGHLWYLKAIVVALLILFCLVKKNVSLKTLIIISSFAYIIGTLFESYKNLMVKIIINIFDGALKGPFTVFSYVYESLFLTTRNGLFMAMIFVVIGILFAKVQVKINKLLSWLGFTMSLCLLIAEAYICKNMNYAQDFNMLFMLVPVDFFLFNIAVNLDFNNKELCKKMRVISSLIFFGHVIVHKYIKIILVVVLGMPLNSLFVSILTLLITSLLSVVIEELSKKDKYKYLKYLYS